MWSKCLDNARINVRKRVAIDGLLRPESSVMGVRGAGIETARVMYLKMTIGGLIYDNGQQ